MQHRVLGSTGVTVSQLCLGTMMFGAWGNQDHKECERIIDRALDAGINFIDTADVYSAGESEEIVGHALAHKRQHVVLATKVNHAMGEDPNARGNSRRWITQEVDNSLRRLGTDWIDLYQIHRPDPNTDIDETLGALTDLVRAGKIRYLGSSTFPAHQIVEAQWIAERRAHQRFVCEQPPYSMLARKIEADVLPVCQKYGLGAITWSPLNGGWLSGSYTTETKGQTPFRATHDPIRFDLSIKENQRKYEAARALAQVASDAGLSLIHLAIGFVLQHPAVTSVIIGPRTMQQIESQLGAAEVRIDDKVLDEIDAIVPPGANLNPIDAGWEPPTISSPRLRRRGPVDGAPLPGF